MSLPFAPIWLRDNGPCRECRDPYNGQKLIDVTESSMPPTASSRRCWCVMFVNTRLLHARTAFEAGGERHLQGRSADLDALQSMVED